MNDASSPTPAIEVRGLAVSYGEQRALDGVSLAVAPGAVVGLLGPNGSGKSTLLSTVAGLRPPAEGEVRLLGAPPSAETRARLGVVFQESCLDPLMTLRETLHLHGRLFGLGGGELRRRVESALGGFGLSARARDRAGTLSGGLRRRLELARALLPSPNVLLLDEPTSGLDPDSRRAFWELLREARTPGSSSPPTHPGKYFDESGGHPQTPARGAAPPWTPPDQAAVEEGAPLTVLLATNDVLEAERECDTVAFLHNGRLVAQGTPAELKGGLRADSVRVACADGRAEALSSAVAGWPGVGAVTRVGAVLHVTVDDASSFVPRLFQEGAAGIHTLQIEPSTLEDAYFQLAGAPLREVSGEATEEVAP